MPGQLISWMLTGRKRQAEAEEMEEIAEGRRLGWREQKDIM